MLLSEAMRRGATIRPGCTGEMFLNGRSCAFGAAAEGAGLFTPTSSYRLSEEEEELVLRRLAKEWPFLFENTSGESARRDWKWSEFMWELIRLNDNEELTRTAIADELQERGY